MNKLKTSTRTAITALSVFILLTCSILILLQSPLSPGSIHYPGSESSLYLYTGSQLLNGSMPYRDTFDFHAPLVFLIDALGLFVGGSFGVWLFEIHFLAITLIIVFALLNRCVGPITALLTSLLFTALVGASLQGGNHIEEYALLFQALALKGFVSYFTKGRLTLLSVYLIGVSAALAFCLNPSILAFWLPFLCALFLMILKKEGLGMALTRLLTIIFSTSLAFILLLPWLHMNNALTSCWNQMAFYYQDLLPTISGPARLAALRFFLERPVFIFIVVISLAAAIKLLILRRQSKKGNNGDKTARPPLLAVPASEAPFGRNTGTLIITNLCAALLVFSTMALPGRTDEHLVLSGLICLLLPMAYLLNLGVQSFLNKAPLRMSLTVALVALLAVFLGLPGFRAALSLAREQRQQSSALAEQQELVREIQSRQSSDEPLIVYGDECWVYVASGSPSATLYAYQPFGATLRPDLSADFQRQATRAEATLLVGRVGEGLVERFRGIDGYERIFKNRQYELYRRIEEVPPSTVQVE
ncbi:MAG: hypothetical protein LBH56_04980 [Coriobacteriales bacterium]|jgi:hypothetical protein|nr:hypothetical protein [Coriobacteriales bacterium]